MIHHLGAFRFDGFTELLRPCVIRAAACMQDWPDKGQIRTVDTALKAGFSVILNLRTKNQSPGKITDGYQAWCKDIRKRWPSIELVMVENEPNSPHDWADGPEAYIEQLRKTKEACHEWIVADGGLQPKALFWSMGPTRKQIEAFYARELPDRKVRELTDEAVADPRTINCMALIGKRMHQWVDRANFHYAHGFYALADVIDYLKTASHQPLMCSGYGCAQMYQQVRPWAEITRRTWLLYDMEVSPMVLMTVEGKKDDRMITALQDDRGEPKRRNLATFNNLVERINSGREGT
jgi:hypothetical protein